MSEPEADAAPTMAEINERLALDDHTGALEMARERLAVDPADQAAAKCVARCERVLTQMYLGRIGSLSQRVRVTMSSEKLQWLSIDHRAGFMVSRVEGATSVEELLEICGMPRLDALRMLHDLLQQKVVTLVDGS